MKVENVIIGAIVAVVGFLLVIIGTSVILKLISIVNSTTADYFVLGGLVVLIVGLGVFGYGWAGKFPKSKLDESAKWSVVATSAATIVVAVIAVVADSTNNLLWTAVTVGALGGLVHEIAQSKGTAFFPDTDKTPSSHTKKDEEAGKKPDDGTSSGGESYLGGLIGILLGGAAGLVALSVSPPASVTTQMIATAFAAGVALKGIADSAASPPKNPSS